MTLARLSGLHYTLYGNCVLGFTFPPFIIMKNFKVILFLNFAFFNFLFTLMFKYMHTLQLDGYQNELVFSCFNFHYNGTVIAVQLII